MHASDALLAVERYRRLEALPARVEVCLDVSVGVISSLIAVVFNRIESVPRVHNRYAESAGELLGLPSCGSRLIASQLALRVLERLYRVPERLYSTVSVYISIGQILLQGYASSSCVSRGWQLLLISVWFDRGASQDVSLLPARQSI